MAMTTATNAETDAAMLGSFSYMAASSEPSLFRNGKVLTRRDKDGSDADWLGVDLEAQQMPIHDARQRSDADRCTLAANGFEMATQPLADPDINFFDLDQVVRGYYPQCADLVRDASGANIVVAFDHNVRSAVGKQSKRRITGGQQVQGPAHVVHGDYTLTSAPQRLQDLTKPPTANDTLRKYLSEGDTLLDEAAVAQAIESGRFAIINVWRNIAHEPVATDPMALCDAASVRPEDLVVFEIHYSDRVGENYFAKHSDTHQWYTYPGLTRDEALLIKQWDSAGELARSNGGKADVVGPDAPCTFSFHSAFEDTTVPEDAPDRWSLEVRCAALYD
jgi:hypothetical protein